MLKITAASIFFCILALASTGQAAEKQISLFGAPKYAAGFSHFDYVNPQAPKQGTVVFPAYGGFDNFNPYIFKGIASPEAAALTTDTLGVGSADDVSTVYPLIAKEFEMPKDKSYVGFILDERAKFHDGSPILAEDVAFSFDALIQKGSPLYKIYYQDVLNYKVLSPRHIRFYFKPGSQNRELPLILAGLPVFSKKYWEGKDFAKPELVPQLGNGPYKISKFEPGKYIVLERVKDYWAADLPSRKGFFNFDEVRYDYYQDTTVTLQALFSGDIDAREEYVAKIWVSGYDNNLVKNGIVQKKEFAHNKTANLQNFGFNLRKEKFKDARVREAIGLAFNFEWANEKLFYNQYRRLNSYFTNSGMEAVDKPAGKELQILKKYEKQLSPEIFKESVPVMPVNPDFKAQRENLRRAVKLLNDAGYDFIDGKMTNLKTGEALEFEILSNSANGAVFTRVMLPFLQNLKKIGIQATFRNLEVNVFKNRLDNFDFDIAILTFGISQMPGNEQMEMWGSKAAYVNGSYNLLGLQNPVVDGLISEMITAQGKEDYQAHIKALDRVLRFGHYMIMQWYSPVQRVAYRNKFGMAESEIKTGFQPFTWWLKNE